MDFGKISFEVTAFEVAYLNMGSQETTVADQTAQV